MAITEMASAALKEVVQTAVKELGHSHAEGLSRKLDNQGLNTTVYDRRPGAFDPGDLREALKSQTDAPSMEVGDMVPSDESGINKEGRTIREIAEEPLTPECEKNMREMLEQAGMRPEQIDQIIDYFKGVCPESTPLNGSELANYDVNGNGCPMPSLKEYVEYAKAHPGMSPAEVMRAVNYSVYRKYLAQKLGVSEKMAGKLIGASDMVIHEDATGRMFLVPNNIHRFKQVYAHGGYVAKMKGQLEEEMRKQG